jgi:hypothetical protein
VKLDVMGNIKWALFMKVFSTRFAPVILRDGRVFS